MCLRLSRSRPRLRLLLELALDDAPRPDAESTPGPEWESALAKALGARTDKLRLAFVAEGGASFARALERAAVSLGAPFWFDALSRIAKLRSTGPPPTGN